MICGDDKQEKSGKARMCRNFLVSTRLEKHAYLRLSFSWEHSLTPRTYAMEMNATNCSDSKARHKMQPGRPRQLISIANIARRAPISSDHRGLHFVASSLSTAP